MTKFMCLCLFLLLNMYNVWCEGLQVESSFTECLTDKLQNQLVFDKKCFLNTDMPKGNYSFPIDKKTSMTVLSKREYVLEEIGFECKMTTYTYGYVKDILLNKHIAGPNIEQIVLTKMDCLTLVTDKLCNKKPMNCASNRTCHYIDPKEINYPFWFGENKQVIYECKFFERIVVANSFTSNVLHDSSIPCYPRDGYCTMATTTVIWETTNLRTCPYERLTVLSDLSFKETSMSSILYSNSENYMFKLQDKFNECNMPLYATSSGLFLVEDKIDKEVTKSLNALPMSRLKMEHFQEKDYRDFSFAEEDFKLMNIRDEIDQIECTSTMNMIQTNIHNDDTYIKLNFQGLYIVFKKTYHSIMLIQCISFFLTLKAKKTS